MHYTLFQIFPAYLDTICGQSVRQRDFGSVKLLARYNFNEEQYTFTTHSSISRVEAIVEQDWSAGAL